jgi:hypothetical protein
MLYNGTSYPIGQIDPADSNPIGDKNLLEIFIEFIYMKCTTPPTLKQ